MYHGWLIAMRGLPFSEEKRGRVAGGDLGGGRKEGAETGQKVAEVSVMDQLLRFLDSSQR